MSNPIAVIKGKKVLLVDDEEDILETLSDLLKVCKLDTALSFEEGKKLLEENDYDVAILDIMGVSGFELLKISIRRDIPTLMLTAHGLSETNLTKSIKNGASCYAPKEEMHKIDVFVADVLDARAKNKNPLLKWFERLSGFYDRRFGGKDWREKEKKFWEERIKPFK